MPRVALIFFISFVGCMKSDHSPVTPVTHESAFSWAKSAPADFVLLYADVAVDPSGNLIAVGSFQDSIRFDPFTLNSTDISGFTVKYDASGKTLWAQKLPPGGLSYASGLCVDYAGNLLVSGFYATDVNSGTSTYLLCKLDPAGQTLWVRSPNTNSDSFIGSPSEDNAGNLFIAGNFGGTLVIDTTKLTAAGSRAALIAKYDPWGNLLWARGSELSGFAVAIAIGSNPLGDIYVAGRFNGVVSFSGNVLSADTTYCGFLLRLNSSGDVLWAKKFISPGTPFDLAVDRDANVFVIGTFDTFADLGTATLSGNSYSSLFLVSYDGQGNLRWAHSLGGTVSRITQMIKMDTKGNCFLAANYYGTISLGTNIFTSNSGAFFLSECTTGGQITWARTFAGSDIFTEVDALVSDNSNNFVIVGKYRSQLNLDGVTLSGNNKSNFFIAKLRTQ